MNMRTFADVVVTVFFGAWLAATILSQLNAVSPRWSRFQWIRTYDWLGLVPVWTFFAPAPPTTDTHLLYRDKLEDGELTPWTEIVMIQRRRLQHVAWNPAKRRLKLLGDAVGLLFRDVSRYANKSVNGERSVQQLHQDFQLTWAYLILLHYISNLPRFPGSAGTQFALLHSRLVSDESGREPQVTFVSAWHAL